MPQFRITFSNPGGELDSATIDATDDGLSVTRALIAMIRHTPLGDGDVITITEITNEGG
jgi:hypothetical protein